MGRLPKKKISEYAESVDNDEQQNEKEGEANNVDGGGDKSVSSVESENEEAESTKAAKESGAADEGDREDTAEDFHSLHEDDQEQNEKNGATKKAAKRKASQNANKKNQEDDDDAARDSEDEPLNGSGSSVAAKRGRKGVAARGKGGKGGKAAAGGRGKGAKKVAEEKEDVDEEPEEEYEVKDIVDHKVERGVTLYLIRWKGYTKDDDTWEPEDTLSCPDIIEKYKKKTATNGTGKASQKKSASPAKKTAKAGGKATKASSKEDPDKEWEVEKIIDYSEDKAGRVFRIRWKGFGPKNDTWEPEKNLSCNDLIDKFMKRMDSQKNISFKELREEPKKTKRLVNETAPRTSYNNAVGRKSKRSGSKKRVFYGDCDE